MAPLLGIAARFIGKQVVGKATTKGLETFGKQAGKGAFQAGGDVLKKGGKEVLEKGGKGAADLLGKAFTEFMKKGGKEALKKGGQEFLKHGGLKDIGSFVTKTLMKSTFGGSFDAIEKMGGKQFEKMFKSSAEKLVESPLKAPASAF